MASFPSLRAEKGTVSGAERTNDFMKHSFGKATALLLLFCMLFALLASCSGSQTLLTVDGSAVTTEIMNYYAYISTSMLELYNQGALDYSAEIEEFGGRKLGDVVKELAYQQILDDYTCLSLAREYDLEFTEDEEALIERRVQSVIDGIGPSSTYRDFLRSVNISDKTYRQMLRNQLLVTKVEEFLMADDGPLALTEEELTAATENYRDDFVNVEYILLSRLDLTTGKELDSASIAEQRKTAQQVRALALHGSDFHKLIDKYSDSKPKDGYSAYIMSYNNTDIPEAFVRAAFALEEGGISDVVSTDYGFYIIKRIPFDDQFRSVVKKTARDEKFDQLVSDTQNRLTVVFTAAYNRYEVG